MHRRPDVGGTQIDCQVRLSRSLVRVVDTGKALDFTRTRLGVHAALVCLLGVLEGCGNVHEVEGTVPFDRLAGSLSRRLKGRNGRHNGGRLSLGELCGDKGNARNVLVTVGPAEAELA
jgi:hypothetical protein